MKQAKSLITYMLFILLFLVSGNNIMAQTKDINKSLAFVNDLVNDEKAYPEAILKLRELHKFNNPAFSDSINHLMGWVYYLQKNMDSSAHYFLQVSQGSPVFYKSRFYAQFNYIYSGKFEEATRLITTLETKDSIYTELKYFQLASIDLLQDDVTAFANTSTHFTNNYFSLKNEEKKLSNINNEMLSFKPKSYFLAGTFSALLPGSGKIYTGKTGEGVAAFLMVGSLAAMTLENYLNDGWNDPKTLFFGGLFTTFYLGNIWGSVVSVKVRREEFYRTKHDEILLDTHIPLRNIFY